MPLSPLLRQIQQQMLYLGYTTVSETPLIVDEDNHKILIIEEEPSGALLLFSMYHPRALDPETIGQLLLLANYGNQQSRVTRFFLNEDTMMFTAFVRIDPPYEPIRFARMVRAMRADIQLVAQHELTPRCLR